MQRQAVFELRNIVVSRLSRFVRVVQSHSAIQTENQEIHIITQASAGAQSYLLGKILQREFAVRA